MEMVPPARNPRVDNAAEPFSCTEIYRKPLEEPHHYAGVARVYAHYLAAYGAVEREVARPLS